MAEHDGSSPRTPKLRAALGVFGLTLIVIVLGGAIFSEILSTAFGVEFRVDTQRGLALAIVLQGGLTLLVIGLVGRWGGYDAPATLRLVPCRQWPVYPVAIVVLLAIGALSTLAVGELARWLPGLEPNALAELVRQSQFVDPGSFALFGAAISLIPGLTEELLFRGFIMTGIRTRFGVVGGVIGSTILFALLHIEPIHMLLVLPPGLFLGYLVVRTGSLYPAVVAHAANNLWGTIESALWQAARPDVSAEEIILGAAYPPAVIVGALILTVLGIWMIHTRTSPHARPPASSPS